MAFPDLIIDQYSALAHKAGLDPTAIDMDLVPTWVNPEARRRLTAYMILDMYMGNVARRMLTADIGPDAAHEIREQGDPRLLVNRIVSGVVGTAPSLRIRGSTEPPPSEPEIPEPPPDADNEDPIQNAILKARREVWETQQDEAVKKWQAAWENWPTIKAAQEWLTNWMTSVRYAAKVYESEANGAVPLGDGVLVMGFDPGGMWPTLTVYEPDAYHPVLDDSNSDEYPSKVHLAWQFTEGDQTYLRRITHELVEVPEYELPWGEKDTVECYLTDKVWQLEGTGLNNWADLDESAAATTTLTDGTPVDNLPLGINWIPILHIPNTPSTQTHFGRSSIANVAQLFDSIIAVDTDIERAAAVAGVPIIGRDSETPATKITLKPGTIIEGKLTPLDLSASLDALRGLQQDQLDRLSINSEVPGPVLGRLDAKVVPSGVALALMYDPFEKLILMLRLTRTVKYPLLGKWAIRWAQVHGTLDLGGPTPTVEALFPDAGIRDLAAIINWVIAAVGSSLMSKSTALRILQESGVPIDDVQTEIERIIVEDLDGAVKVADATGSEKAAADRLGIELETTAAVEPEQAPPVLPPFGATA